MSYFWADLSKEDFEREAIRVECETKAASIPCRTCRGVGYVLLGHEHGDERTCKECAGFGDVGNDSPIWEPRDTP